LVDEICVRGAPHEIGSAAPISAGLKMLALIFSGVSMKQNIIFI
jgi:hypothetical protein